MTLNAWIGKVFGRAVGCPCHEDLFDFALDGLEVKQQGQVRKHLADCPHCRDQVKDYAWVSEGIALLAPQVEPPAGICDKVKMRIHAEAGAVELEGSPFDPLQGWPRFWMRLGPVFLVLSIGMSGLALFTALHSAAGSASSGQVSELLGSSSLKELDLLGQGENESGAHLYFASASPEILLHFDHLQPNMPGETYVLWESLDRQAPQYVGALQVRDAEPSSYIFHLDAPLGLSGSQVSFLLTHQNAGAPNSRRPGGPVSLQGSLKL